MTQSTKKIDSELPSCDMNECGILLDYNRYRFSKCELTSCSFSDCTVVVDTVVVDGGRVVMRVVGGLVDVLVVIVVEVVVGSVVVVVVVIGFVLVDVARVDVLLTGVVVTGNVVVCVTFSGTSTVAFLTIATVVDSVMLFGIESDGC